MDTCPHCRGPLSVDPPATPEDFRALRARSTETEAQEQRALAALRTGPKSTDELRRMGLYQAPARIFSLREKGYNIETEWYDGIASDGYSHARLGRYRLISEPLEPLAVPKARKAAQKAAGATDGGEAACTH